MDYFTIIVCIQMEKYLIKVFLKFSDNYFFNMISEPCMVIVINQSIIIYTEYLYKIRKKCLHCPIINKQTNKQKKQANKQRNEQPNEQTSKQTNKQYACVPPPPPPKKHTHTHQLTLQTILPALVQRCKIQKFAGAIHLMW